MEPERSFRKVPNSLHMSQNGPNGNINASGKSRDWCITINNPEEKWEFPNDASITYYVFQRERGENGTLHIQGFVQFKNPRALGGVKKLFPTAHLESRRGSAQEAADYCKKDDSREEGCSPVEWGTLKPGDRPGRRNDLQAVKEAIVNGATKRDLLEDHSEVLAKYPKFIHDYQDLHSPNLRPRVENFLLRPWQDWLWHLLDGPVDDRAIYWIFDKNGGKGKSWFSNILIQEKDVFYCNGGKANDLLYAYTGQPIAIFDYARDYESYVGYGPMEQIKNGMFFSSKYSSQMKRYKVPHVVVFANFMIDKTKLSQDRIHVIDFHDDGSVWWSKPHTPIKERIE